MRHFVFDLDGVLIDSEPVKLAAFVEAVAEVCAPDAARLAEVAAWNAANRGVPRDAKIAHVLREILGAPPHLAPAVASRYAEKLADRLPRCRPLPGVAAFLASVGATLHVASSAPEAEIRAHLERHGLLRHFSTLSGHPRGKLDVLSRLRDAHPAATIVFFGDAPADLEAAMRAGVAFVAVNPTDDLRPLVTRWVPDFADASAVLAAADPSV
ncbi:MAG TPA: HAD family hydrolase [Longimicrobiaceae bacterium]|nr:HAD family hydrolase [Longimicrobiaceae bacterium]